MLRYLKSLFSKWLNRQKYLFRRELDLRSQVYSLTSQLRVLQKQHAQMFRVIMFVADQGCATQECSDDITCPSCTAKSFLGLHGIEPKYSQPYVT